MVPQNAWPRSASDSCCNPVPVSVAMRKSPHVAKSKSSLVAS